MNSASATPSLRKDRTRITSRDWSSYPILRFSAVRIRLPAERALCHPPRDLVFAHDDEIGAVALQVLNLSIGMSARDDLDLRVRRAPLLDNLPSLKPIRDGDQEAARLSQIGRSVHLRRGGVALDRFDAESPQFLDQLLLVLDDQERLLLALQLLTHATPDAPETEFLSFKTPSLDRRSP
jgi:hypothetical protein